MGKNDQIALFLSRSAPIENSLFHSFLDAMRLPHYSPPVFWTRARLLFAFCLITCALSWPPVYWLWSQGATWNTPAGRAVGVWQTFSPLLAALLIQGPLLKKPVLKPLGISFKPNIWWLFAWLAPVLIIGVAMLLIAALGGELVLTREALIANKQSLVPPEQLEMFHTYLKEHPMPSPFMLILMGLPAGLTFNLMPAFAEEVGLRGFLFREIPGGYWKRSVLIGLFWAAWMAPSVALGSHYAAHAWQALPLFVIWCVVASLVLVYIRVRSDSVIATAIMRGTMFALTKAAADLTFGTSELLMPFYGVGGVLGLLVLLAICAVHDRYYAAARLMHPSA